MLVERSEKKCLFLEAVIREARRDNVRVETRDLQARAGAAEESAFYYVISRATLPTTRYLELAGSRAKHGGRIFLFAGEAAKDLCGHPSRVMNLLSMERIPGRRDSCLFVLERHA